MDLWDYTKVLFRRWYFAVPVLVLSGVFAIVIASTVKPDYQASSYVTLLPPPALTPEEVQQGTLRNSWLDLGIDTLGNASTLTLGDKSIVDGLESGGYSSVFVVEQEGYSLIYRIDVTADSPEQATRTADRVASLFEAAVADLQRQYGASASRFVTTKRIKVGGTVTTNNSKVKRALIAVAGAGLLVTIAFTVALDALLRRRARRKAGLPDEFATAPELPNRPPLANRGGGLGSPAPPPRTATAQSHRTALPPAIEAPASSGRSTPGPRPDPQAGRPIGVSYRSGSGEAAEDVPSVDEIPDATIVLPPTPTRWRPDNGGRR